MLAPCRNLHSPTVMRPRWCMRSSRRGRQSRATPRPNSAGVSRRESASMGSSICATGTRRRISFSRSFLSLSSICGPASFGIPNRWCRSCLALHALTVLEQRRGRARREQLLEAHIEEGIEMDPEISSEAQRRRLISCLRNLTERERSVVLLTFCADTPTEEVADDLGLESGNVRVIRHRALQRLRDCLDAASP